MRMDLPGCDLHDCRYHFDGNCIKADEGKRWLWEECPHTKTFLLEEENADLKIKVEELKNNIEKAKHLLETFVEEIVKLPGCYRTMVVDDAVLEAKLFLNWRI